MIHERQQQEGWSASIIPRLSRDLKNELPEVKGFSERNLGRMLAFFRNYQDFESFLPQPVAKSEIVQRTVAQIPWRSNLTLLDKLDDPELRGILFEVSVPTINEHRANISKSCELRESATVRKFRIVQTGSSAIGQQLVARLENESR